MQKRSVQIDEICKSMKKVSSVQIITLIFMAVIFLLSTIVYVGNALNITSSNGVDLIEMISYIFGYVLTDVCLGYAIYEVSCNKGHKGPLWIAFACMVIRFAYDIMTSSS